MTNNEAPDKTLVEQAREAAATIFDRIARKSRNTDVCDLNRHYAKKIRAGEGDDFDAVQSALLALSQPQHGGLVEAHRFTGDESDLRMRFNEAIAGGPNMNGDSGWIIHTEGHADDLERAIERIAALASNSPVVGEDGVVTCPVCKDADDAPYCHICCGCGHLTSEEAAVWLRAIHLATKPTPTPTPEVSDSPVVGEDAAIGSNWSEEGRLELPLAMGPNLSDEAKARITELERMSTCELIEACKFPLGSRFSYHDEPGEHDPAWVVIPGGEMLSVNGYADGDIPLPTDAARAAFIVLACNAALAKPTPNDTADQQGHNNGSISTANDQPRTNGGAIRDDRASAVGDQRSAGPTDVDTADRREAVARVVARLQRDAQAIRDDMSRSDEWAQIIADKDAIASLIAVPDGMALTSAVKEQLRGDYTDAGMEDAFFRWPAIESAMIAAATGEAK